MYTFKWQRCVVHGYRNAFTMSPWKHVKSIAAMLKAIHAQEDREVDFPYEHWTRLRTNNALERIMKEIRRRTRVIGAFPDGYSAMMLVGARLRHISITRELASI